VFYGKLYLPIPVGLIASACVYVAIEVVWQFIESVNANGCTRLFRLRKVAKYVPTPSHNIACDRSSRAWKCSSSWTRTIAVVCNQPTWQHLEEDRNDYLYSMGSVVRSSVAASFSLILVSAQPSSQTHFSDRRNTHTAQQLSISSLYQNYKLYIMTFDSLSRQSAPQIAILVASSLHPCH
jgi:hypothetical protein